MTFNEHLQSKYPFIKKTVSDSDDKCNKYRIEFSVSHGVGSDIKQYLKSNKHETADMTVASSSKLTKWFHQEILRVHLLYQGKWNPARLAEYC